MTLISSEDVSRFDFTAPDDLFKGPEKSFEKGSWLIMNISYEYMRFFTLDPFNRIYVVGL